MWIETARNRISSTYEDLDHHVKRFLPKPKPEAEPNSENDEDDDDDDEKPSPSKKQKMTTLERWDREMGQPPGVWDVEGEDSLTQK